MGEGNTALPAPPRTLRRKIRVLTPCGECRFAGLCSIEQQIEENLVLEVIEIARDAKIELLCSEFEHSDSRKRPRSSWSDDRRARFAATIRAKREQRTMSAGV